MLKLVSQFDDEKMRASVATPTCGPCCCCCCCCVVTTLASGILTARSLGRAVEESQPKNQKVKKTDLKSQKKMAYLIGLFLIPVHVGIGILLFAIIDSFVSSHFFNSVFSEFTGILVFLVQIASPLASPVLSLFYLKKRYGKSAMAEIIVILVATIVAFCAEFYIWFSLLV